MENYFDLAPDPGLLRVIQSAGREVLGSIPASVLASRISQYFSKRREIGKQIPFNNVFPDEQITVLHKLGLTLEVMEQVAQSCLTPPVWELRSGVARTVNRSLRTIYDVISVLTHQLTPATDMCQEFKGAKCNAWLVACLLYGGWKVRKFLPDIIIDSEELSHTIDICQQWLLSANVIRRGENGTGWDDKPATNELSPALPLLHDTAFVANILIKIAPDHEGTLYEECLKTLLSMRDKGSGLWLDRVSGQIDIAGSSHVLRFLSNYLKHRQHVSSRDELEEIRKSIYYALCDLQCADGHWKSSEEITNISGGLSSKAVTALVLQALRDGNIPRGVTSVLMGCQWLLNELEYNNEVWCWTIRSGQDKTPSVYESAWIVSALLKASTYSQFARAELVIEWLRTEVENRRLLHNDVVHFGTAVCAMADYLRAWNIRDFFNY